MITKISLILFAVLLVSGLEEEERWKRSLQPGAPNVNNNDQPWQVSPHISRDDSGNTKTDINVQRHGENNDFEAGWSKVVRGPNKAKPTWHIGGTHRWRRSLQPGAPNINNKDQPWQVSPHISRDDNGNTRTNINVQRHGENNDFEAGWSKVVRGPNKAKPTWHIGGTHRWRRSLQPGAPNVNNKDQPWQVSPHISRDDSGNTRTNINVQRHGENNDFEAGWSKVVRGPNKAKPTWHIGGTHRWRRSLQPGAPNVNNKDQPWQVSPHISRDDSGNTNTDINLQRHGENHDFDAGWSKVVRGPNKAKPTWHVGGTYRWRRSVDIPHASTDNVDETFWEFDPHTEDDDDKPVLRLRRSDDEDEEEEEDQPWQLNPNIARGDDGNTRADVNIKRRGENHDFEAGWSKVVDGPDRAKPTWHVGGTFRW
uniref:Acaloleptin A n=1 Tax=Acalolepta luxuriosa TaxID=85306 RepID=ACALA_ACALU|nr:RecName: Full=Acaloleptin A; Contains: RecName: Full=Acaloleptin A1; Contains: RecName: Full=Acaloleptin A2; Contains: RecName: Full=Acaloleptin A3; Contains: RecName: Full=Acaloleptin A4; Contains: RecName: Full=Acidic peptide; Contains: RecName: Full=Acaloleptin A5; Flags: Precursor [Acalolepta luxuriosa]BAC82199.1 acaloleptin A precursor [Acalolepta luxuriosa]